MRRILTGISLLLLIGVSVLWIQKMEASRQGRALHNASWAAQPGPVVILGTSLTARSTWPDVVSEELQSCAGRATEVVAIAAAGATSVWGEGRLDDVIALDPALVLIELEVNDADILDGLWPWESHDTHDRILTRLRAELPQSDLVLMIMNPSFGLRGLMRVGRSLYRQSYYGLARSHDTGLVDMTGRWRDLVAARGRVQIIPDGLHPTDEAARGLVPAALTAALCGG